MRKRFSASSGDLHLHTASGPICDISSISRLKVKGRVGKVTIVYLRWLARARNSERSRLSLSIRSTKTRRAAFYISSVMAKCRIPMCLWSATPIGLRSKLIPARSISSHSVGRSANSWMASQPSSASSRSERNAGIYAGVIASTSLTFRVSLSIEVGMFRFAQASRRTSGEDCRTVHAATLLARSQRRGFAGDDGRHVVEPPHMMFVQLSKPLCSARNGKPCDGLCALLPLQLI